MDFSIWDIGSHADHMDSGSNWNTAGMTEDNPALTGRQLCTINHKRVIPYSEGT